MSGAGFKIRHKVLRDSGMDPWTVSVTVLPGKPACPELDALDRKLSKDRGWRADDQLIDAWKARIVWPRKIRTFNELMDIYIRGVEERSKRDSFEAFGIPMIRRIIPYVGRLT